MSADDQDKLTAARPGLARWLDRGAWALCDQALFAGSNFFVNICLARWLSPEDYGAFASAYAVFLLLGVFHTALLSEPMLVFGPGRHRANLAGYWRLLVVSHMKFAAAAGGLLALAGAAALLLDQRPLGQAMLALAVVQAFLYLPWMLRDACYVVQNPRSSALAGAWYFAIVAAGLGALWRFERVGIVTALAAMGVAALAASASIVRSLRIPVWRHADAPEGVAADHWRYGRWAIATGLTHYVPQNLPLLLVPVVIGYAAGAETGYAEGGALKALMNLTVPFVLAGWAFSNLIVPLLVTRRNTPDFGRISLRVSGLLVLLAVVVWLPVAIFGERVLGLIYGGHFADHAALLWPIGLIPLLTGPTIVVSAALRAIERPDRVFFGSLASALTLVAAGLPLLLAFGLTGIIAAMAVSHAVMLGVMAWAGWDVLVAATRPAARDGAESLRPLQLTPLPDRPLVSVLLCSYNYERYLGQAIASVAGQTYDRWELIVCDDGSTDGSAEVVAAMARHEPRIRLVTKANGGQASALNAAFAESCGDIVCMLDADDRFAPDKLARLVRHYSDNTDVGLSVHAMNVVAEDGRPIQRIPFLTAFERGWIAERVIRRGGRWRYMPTSALSMRRELADRLFPMPEPAFRTSADSFLFTVGPLIACVDYIDEALADYRLHGANLYSTQAIDLRSCEKARDAVRLQIVESNRWLESRDMDIRLDHEQHRNFQEQELLVRALTPHTRSLGRNTLRLLGRILHDDLYGLPQKLLALPTFGLLLLLPRSRRAGWLTFTMSYGSHKRWLHLLERLKRRRPPVAVARPMAPAPLAPTSEVMG